jgi:hypothetical protein
VRAAADVDDYTAVYRCYDSADRLLYVGASCLGSVRFNQHQTEKGWWPGVARIQVEHYANRAEALAAERAAIESEAPTMNVHFGSRPSIVIRRQQEGFSDRRRGVPPEIAKGLLRLRRRQQAAANARRDVVLAAHRAGVSLGRIADLAGLHRVDVERVIWFAEHSKDGRAALPYR